MYAAVLGVTTTGSALAAPWSEFGVAQPLRPAEQLTEASCDMSLELRGTIAEVEIRQRITNPGPAALAASTEFELPPGAQLTGMSLQRGRGKVEAAIPVTTWSGADEKVVSRDVLASDPALLLALGTYPRPRFRFIAQPIEPEQEITVHTRWVAVAEIEGGALRLRLPGRGEDAPVCRVLAHVQPGPGASVARMRADKVELGLRSTASFDLGAADTTLTAVLAFKRTEPLLWVQTQTLGEGYTARATTVLAPTARSSEARRALFVIDGSRSMELVGRHNVTQIVRSLAASLPQKAEIEAVIYDRAAARVLDAWKPATTETLDAIDNAISKHAATNGSDTEGAFAFAHKLIDGLKGETLVVVITDGVLGDVSGSALIKALGLAQTELDLHLVALSPGRMRAPAGSALRSVVQYYGGSYLDVPTRELDNALVRIDSWLRPAWQEVALVGAPDTLPNQLRAGEGITIVEAVKQAGTLKVTARGTKPVTVKAGKAPTAPLAQLALAAGGDDDESARARLRERHVAVDTLHPFAVLSSTGTVAANRRAMVIGGGPYTRMVDAPDPKFPRTANTASAPIVIGGSAIDRNTVTLLLKQYLQPAAFVCYQRALAKDSTLAGTAKFTLEIGRGELTRASVVGVGNAAFDACLLDAAYQVTPPLPNPDYNTDDRSVVNYPLTFSMREQKPFVVAGDADSSSPLDIDKIEGGVPVSARRGPIKAGDTSTPLGGLRPTPMK